MGATQSYCPLGLAEGGAVMNVLKYKKANYRYQLVEAYVIALSFLVGLSFETDYFKVANGELTVKERYAWDGLSIPFQHFIFRIPIFGTWFEKVTLAGSLVHDVCYQIDRLQLVVHRYRFKLSADRALRILCIAYGLWRVLAWIIYAGVFVFGNLFTKPSQEPSTKEVRLDAVAINI